MIETLPSAVKACLWSYDTDQIDFSLPDHRARVIENVLDHGTSAAIDWLAAHFDREEIVSTIAGSIVSEWHKKSLALWSLVFNVQPQRQTRFS